VSWLNSAPNRGGRLKPNELDPLEALAVVDPIAELGVRAVSLTGGEPLLPPDWRSIAKRVRTHGMVLRLASNGHLLDDQSPITTTFSARASTARIESTRPVSAGRGPIRRAADDRRSAAWSRHCGLSSTAWMARRVAQHDTASDEADPPLTEDRGRHLPGSPRPFRTA
jgi:hypothetical protein